MFPRMMDRKLEQAISKAEFGLGAPGNSSTKVLRFVWKENSPVFDESVADTGRPTVPYCCQETSERLFVGCLPCHPGEEQEACSCKTKQPQALPKYRDFCVTSGFNRMSRHLFQDNHTGLIVKRAKFFLSKFRRLSSKARSL